MLVWNDPSEVTALVPTLGDRPEDMVQYDSLWALVQSRPIKVTFDFSTSRFLVPSAVAFIGGIARMVEYHGGTVHFSWESARRPLLTNLKQNGFAAHFGHPRKPWQGNSVPFREDRTADPAGISDFLRSLWVGRDDFIHVSPRLRDAVVGVVWEIYANAFEHSSSPIGIVTCGQYFPMRGELRLSVLDMGVGIPANVRGFWQDVLSPESLDAARCLRWAFRRGSSTKAGKTGRGVGLDLLKSFVKVNKGKLEFYSELGYCCIDSELEHYANRPTAFSGTLVCINLRCDGSYYLLSSEREDRPLF